VNSKSIERAEWITAVLLSLTVLFFLIVRTTHAGGLWRDECGAVQLARMTSLSDIVNNFQFETFPPPFPVTIRVYTALFGTSDISLRCFGFAVGVALIYVAWFSARVTGDGVPLILLALLGLNPTFLEWGTTFRGNGLGCVLIVLALCLTARLLLEPKASRIAAALLASVCAVQFAINNLVLALAIAFSATAACLIRRSVKLALVVGGIGACCAASVIGYLRIYSAADWNIGLKYPGHFFSIWHAFNSASGNALLWHIIFLAAVGAGVWRLAVNWHSGPARQSLVLLFSVFVCLTAPLGYYAFLRILGYNTQQSYLLPIVSLLAAAVDLVIAQLRRVRLVRVARLVLVIVVVIIFPLAAWPKVIRRQTTVDLVAQRLQQEASPNDLIVVNPWFFGVSFNWYYHGATRWLTVPVISDHRIHRWDLVKTKMMASAPLDDLERAMSATLESGNRVWLVGGARLLRENGAPLKLSPAPDPKFGWKNDIYEKAWSEELGAFLQQHALRTKVILPPGSAVNNSENVPLWLAEGWKG
jgi:hypothetical protein